MTPDEFYMNPTVPEIMNNKVFQKLVVASNGYGSKTVPNMSSCLSSHPNKLKPNIWNSVCLPKQ